MGRASTHSGLSKGVFQGMLISEENLKARNKIFDFEKRTEEMHLAFQKYHQRLETKRPDWEGLEKDMLVFSRKKVYDLELSKQLDRVLYKFQNRKKIWLKWIEEYHQAPDHE
jgi:hypothetical protein